MAELLITFRETLEAALIIGILFTFISKTGKDYLKSSVLGGLTSAIIASIVFAIFFQMVLGGFSGKAEAIFEGIVMIIAAALLSSMIIWMARNKNVSESLENQASAVLENKKNAAKGMFLLAFVSVFREGIETVLFLYGILIKDNSLSIVSSLAGILIAIVIGYLIFIQGKRVPLKTFFNVTSILLIFVAAGLVSYGIHEFEEASIIPYYGAIWDINHLLNEKSTLGAFAKGLFGYNGNPSAIETVAYLLTFASVSYFWSQASATPLKIQKNVQINNEACPSCFEDISKKGQVKCSNCNHELDLS